MKLKQKPEDFIVTESWRFDKVAKGEYRVYVMDKQKVSTFDAIDRIGQVFELPRSVFSFCGLKDKQGRTEQLIAVRGAEVDYQDDDLQLKFVGRTDKPLSAANITSNRFGVTVRALSDEEMDQLPEAVAEINRCGVINYFDSQRFGSLKHGQGFIVKDLIRGDFEAALKNFMALPSDLDKTYDAKVKAYWRDRWGSWKLHCSIPGAEKYEKIVRSLRHDPKDFRKAFLQIDSKTRAMLVFTYQSFLWNESVRRYLMSVFAGQSLIALSYQAGKLLFPREIAAPELSAYKAQTFPLLAPETTFRDPEVKKAVEWVLGREKLTLDKLQIPGTPEIFFRHEERPLVVFPGKLMLGPGREDEYNRGKKKAYIAFTLPPGAYATLAIRRLFSFSEQENREHEKLDIEVGTPSAPPREAVVKRPPRDRTVPPQKAEKVETPSEPKLGFRAQQKLKREKKEAARTAATKRAAAQPPKKKPHSAPKRERPQ